MSYHTNLKYLDRDWLAAIYIFSACNLKSEMLNGLAFLLMIAILRKK